MGWGLGMDTPQKTRKSGAGDVPMAILSLVTKLVEAAENVQNFNKI